MIVTSAAIEFAAPGWLYALASVSLPILAHLSARRTGPPAVLPTQRFVAQAIRHHQHRRAPVDYLLLTMRCLIVALIVLAFARPEWSSVDSPTFEKRGLQAVADEPRENPSPSQLKIAVVSDEDADDPATATFYLKRLAPGSSSEGSGWRVEVVRTTNEVDGFDAAIVVNDMEVDVPALRMVGEAGEVEAVMLEPMDPRPRKGPWEVFRGPAMRTLREVEFRAVAPPDQSIGASDVLARWSNSEPAIWWDPRNCRTLIFNADISPAHSDLVRSAAFVPLMHELIGVLVESGDQATAEVIDAAGESEQRAANQPEKWPLWRLLIAGALLVMVAESILAKMMTTRYAIMRIVALAMVMMLLLPAESTAVESREQETAGSSENQGNVSVTVDASSTIAFTGEPIRIAAIVRQEGLDGRNVTAELLMDGETLESANVRFEAWQAQREIVFTHIPGGGDGWVRYAVRVEPVEGETDTNDNADETLVRRMGRRIQVLMIEGQPVWSSRWFADAMRRDRRIALTQMVAYGERRTAVLDSRSRGLPPAAIKEEAFADCDVVVLGRRIERLVNRAEIESLVDFVIRRGGGLVLTRGENVTNDPQLAEALATVVPTDPGGSVARRIGAGRVIVVRDDNQWREALAGDGAAGYRQSVASMIRFAAFADETGASDPVDLMVDPMNVEVDEEVRIEARLRRELDEIRVAVHDPTGEVAAVKMTDDYGKPLGQYRPTAIGLHMVELNAGGLGEPVRTAFLVKPAAVEQDEHAMMDTIEDEHGGPMWDRWWVLALLIGLLSVEWFMRRRAGLR